MYVAMNMFITMSMSITYNTTVKFLTETVHTEKIAKVCLKVNVNHLYIVPTDRQAKHYYSILLGNKNPRKD